MDEEKIYVTNVELEEMINKISEYLNKLLALIKELFDGLSMEYKGYKSVF